jgi:hypothetical protein
MHKYLHFGMWFFSYDVSLIVEIQKIMENKYSNNVRVLKDSWKLQKSMISFNLIYLI